MQIANKYHELRSKNRIPIDSFSRDVSSDHLRYDSKYGICICYTHATSTVKKEDEFVAVTNSIFEHLAQDLDDVATRIDVDSILIMRSTATHMRVEASGGVCQDIYPVGALGKKAGAYTEARELYCERVVNTARPLFVRDAATDPEWAENEDLVEYGLGNYLGYPVHDSNGNIYGTVCVLSRRARDYSDAEAALIANLRDTVEQVVRERDTEIYIMSPFTNTP